MALTVETLQNALGNKFDQYIEGEESEGNVTLAHAVDAANDRVDNYLRARYTLPISPEPASILDAKVTVARFILSCNFRPDLAANTVTHEDLAYNETIRYLEKIAKGEILLSFPAENVSSEAIQSGSVTMGSNVNACEVPYLTSKQGIFRTW